MRIANLAGRLVVIDGAPGQETATDVERASGGLFGPDPQAVYERWEEFTGWAADGLSASSLAAVGAEPGRFDLARLGPPVPLPRQVLAIGLNYGEHAAESGYAAPQSEPPVFTKFVSCLTGPFGDVTLPPGGHTDWEIELVAVIGRRAERVAAADALSYVAGFCAGQDLSERVLQLAATPPQFSLGKSLPGFGPIGPWVVTLDELAGRADPGDLALSCSINGAQVQTGRTSQMIFAVPELIARLSAAMPLLPGDIIFTGTPPGVGLGRTPPVWLEDGDVLESQIEGIGTMRHRFVASAGC